MSERIWTNFRPDVHIVLLYEERILRLYKPCAITLGAGRLPGAQPPAGPPKTNIIEGEAYFPEIVLQHANLESPQYRATEFS